MDLLNHIKQKDYEKVARDLSEDSRVIEDLPSDLHEVESGWFYRFLIKFLTNLDMSEEEATRHYFAILEHKVTLSESLNRDIGLRVATLDYFVNIHKKIHNPKILEIDLYEELLKMTKEDPKTGCFNARFLQDFVAREIKRSERNFETFSILMIDLDDFKKMNDRHGHLFGDHIIKKFADEIITNARREDILARFGGDEFAVVLPHTGRIGARSYAERLKLKLLRSFENKEFMGTPVDISFSVGIATYPHDGDTYESLFQVADSALYRAKSLGKNRIFDSLEAEYYTQMQSSSDRRHFMRQKIAEDTFIDLKGLSDFLSIEAKVVDISLGGVLLECQAALDEKMLQKSFELHLALSKDQQSALDVEGRVIRFNRESGRLRFNLGIQFEQLIHEDVWKKTTRSADAATSA